MPARAIWDGSIGFGMSHIPVKLYTAVSEQDIKFKRWHAETDSYPRQVQLVRDGEEIVNPDGTTFQPSKEVPISELSRVFVRRDGSKVEITDEDLARIRPASRRHMQVEYFIPLSEVDPIYMENTYWLGYGEFGEYAYTLFCQALMSTQRAAVVKVTMRTKQHLALIHIGQNGQLCLTTMYYASEIASANATYFNQVEVNPAEIQTAIQIINSMTGQFDPDNYWDEQYERTHTLINEKFEGREYSVEAPIPDAPTEPIGETLAADLARLHATNREPAMANARRSPDNGNDYIILDDREVF